MSRSIGKAKPKHAHTRRFVMSPDDQSRYLDALPQEMKLFCLFLIETGLRVSEALSLEWRRAELAEDPGYVRISDIRSGETRKVPLTPAARGVLEFLQAGEGLLFPNKADGCLSKTWLAKQHAAVRNRLGLPPDFVLHSLRYTFRSRLRDAGTDVFKIMRLMGRSVRPFPETYLPWSGPIV